MKITWFGQSCFLIEAKDGCKILTDPFDNSLGYELPSGDVDIVTISHHHRDHDYVSYIKKSAAIIDSIGDKNIKDIVISGKESFHDKFNGEKRGKNIIFKFLIDGFSICHLGDLGHELDSDFINWIGDLDILMIPVGGNYTIDGTEAASIASKINSHLIIPMHFGTAALSFPLEGAEKFITSMKNGEKLASSYLEMDSVPEDRKVVKILRYQNKI
ncbi:MBL fold metallo-hydrolase [Clostridium sp. 19966]|uniref:MBL fold metallo-hydrolase n=1 Tax=Clostridium sp. 19966 TaxID=2768166 RepID=UPI0028DDC1D6|nr:MBL fold metallo-hydrolase [Clostridium sp. 19966]MDT8715783.1 MBL fold metallo-hydrolase [Clostridium sp. 19966]